MHHSSRDLRIDLELQFSPDALHRRSSKTLLYFLLHSSFQFKVPCLAMKRVLSSIATAIALLASLNTVMSSLVRESCALCEPQPSQENLTSTCYLNETAVEQYSSLYDQIPSVITVFDVISKLLQALNAPTRSTSPDKLKTRPVISSENSKSKPEYSRVVVQLRTHQPSLQSLFDEEHRQELNPPAYQHPNITASRPSSRVISQTRDESTTRESNAEDSPILNLNAASRHLVDFLFSLSCDILGVSASKSTSPDIKPVPLMKNSIEELTTATAFKSSKLTEAEDNEPTRTQRHELSELEQDSFSVPTFASTTAGVAHG
jgi:hypothetical protein